MILLLLSACGSWPRSCDLALRGGTIYTMVPGAPPTDAIGLDGGRVVALGDDVARCITLDTDEGDLHGAVVLPGFIDTHTHPVWGGVELLGPSLGDATSLEAALDVVRAYAEAHPELPWIVGGGWDAPTLEGRLDRRSLDAIVPDRPVYLASADGHSAWVNGAALAEAGIGPDTPDPDGGEIVRDDRGRATGILREEALALVEEHLPPTPPEVADAGLARALALVHAAGITTLVDANAEGWALDAYVRADLAGRLDVRVLGMVEALPGEGVGQIARISAMRAEYASPLVAVTGVKLYLDGVLESRTGALLAPYDPPDEAAAGGGSSEGDGPSEEALAEDRGELLFEDADLDAILAAADREALDIHAHAIGDAAVRQYLDAVERLSASEPPRDRRPIAAHLELVDPLDVPRFAELGVYASFSPLWAYPDPYVTELTVPAVGPDRAARLYPIGALLAAGATVVGGSDWSVSSMDPWDAIEVAVLRQDPEDATGEVLGAAERIDVEAAIAAYTREAARAVGLEEELGTLAVGKRADMVILDRDPFTIDPRSLSDVEVLYTCVGADPSWGADRDPRLSPSVR